MFGTLIYIDRTGKTPLMYCSAKGRLDCIQVLIQASANVNLADGADTRYRTERRRTPLVYSSEAGHLGLDMSHVQCFV